MYNRIEESICRNQQMIDTVTFHQDRVLLNPGSIRSAIYGYPRPIHGFNVECIGPDTFRLSHKSTGLVAVFGFSELRYARVSLSRILFGDNGYLISRQSHITTALRAVDTLLDAISRKMSVTRTFSRVDLVWQFERAPADFHAAHSHCVHPLIRKPVVDFNNNGLEWRGTKIKIKMYDKLLKHSTRPGNVYRVEVELRGRRLRKILGHGQPITALDFLDCYATYRQLLCGFTTKPQPNISDIVDLIAYAQKLGLDLWPYWSCTYKNRQSRNRARKQLLARKLTYFAVDWKKLLPATRPFSKVDIDCQTGRVITTALFRIAPRKQKFCL